MLIQKAVLAAITQRDSWDRYGDLFTVEFWEGETGQSLYRIIEHFWKHAGPRIKSLDTKTAEALIRARVSKTDAQARRIRYLRDALSIPQGKLEPLIQEALYSWAARREIAEASERLLSGRFNAADVAARFDLLATATTNSDGPEEAPDDEVRRLLKLEVATGKYPTRLAGVDTQLDGGLWSGEVGVVMGPSYRGKTWVLTYLGGAALLSGVPVQHHTFEISRRRTAIRYYQSMLHRDRARVLEHPQATQTALRKLKLPPWSIKDHSAYPVTTGKIRQHMMRFVQDCKAAGFKKPPLFIVDYIDLIQAASGASEGRFALAAIVKELRESAARFEVGIWTASQTHRGSYNADHIYMENVAESIAKVERADVVITLNQNQTEDAMDIMRWKICKARERTVDEPEQYLRTHKAEQTFTHDPEYIEGQYYGDKED